MRLPSARRPWVAASLVDFRKLPDDARRARAAGADLLEVRADLFPKDALSTGVLLPLLKKIRKKSGLPVLLTLRFRREGGRWPFSEKRRSALYEALLPAVDAVDVEGASAVAGRVLRAARRAGCWTVLSHHDFSRTPTEKALNAVVRRFRRSGADVLKVAAMPRAAADVERLMSFCGGLTGLRRAFIAMGPRGRQARLKGYRWGSCLTYGFVGKSAAPGQVPARALALSLRRFLDARQERAAR